MAVITVYGKTPDVGSAAFVAPNATLAGDVVLAAGSSVWYGAVVRGDTGAIRIGKNSNIQDNAVLHTGPNLGVTIGKNVSIGHSAVVHGCTVGDGALIGMHATVMNGAVVGKNAVVAAGALVLENTVIPDGMVAMGVPSSWAAPVASKPSRTMCSSSLARWRILEMRLSRRRIFSTMRVRKTMVRMLVSAKLMSTPTT